MKLLFVGDVAIGAGEHSDWPWLIPGDLPGNDYKIVLNWELPIGDSINTTPRVRGPRLCANVNAHQTIQQWSPGIATLATNHILDCSTDGLINTIESLNRIGFSTVGAGRTTEEIERPFVMEMPEGRLTIFNWVFPETHPEWSSVPGPNCWPGLGRAKELLQNFKEESDWMIGVLHWSDELTPYPRAEDRTIAFELAQMGMDIIIGHHPHVVRGMELINSTPVYYSLGNFFFSDFMDNNNNWIVKGVPRTKEGLGVEIQFERGQLPICRYLSFWQGREQVSIDFFKRAQRRMTAVSLPLKKYSVENYSRWRTDQITRSFKLYYLLNFSIRKHGIKGIIQIISNKIRSKL